MPPNATSESRAAAGERPAGSEGRDPGAALARSVRVMSPAKLNLFLHVVGRRADGYHLLESLLVMVDFGDRLAIEPRADGDIVRTGGNESIPVDDDLAIRAARLLKARTSCPLGASIAVDKRIPLGGGLGGGSSNAATVLLALNRLWGLELSRQALMSLALELGADVPFFVFGESALATGVGERLRAVSVPPAWFLVATPPVAVSTAAVFGSSKLTRDSLSSKIPLFPETYGRNDLQPVVARSFPAVAEHLAVLGRLGEARMTGSGACVFVAFGSECAAHAARRSLPDGFAAFVSRLLPQHPLRRWTRSSSGTDRRGLPLGSRQAG